MSALVNNKILKRVLGDPQAATVKRHAKRAKEVEKLSDEYKKLTDAKLKAKTKNLKTDWQGRQTRQLIARGVRGCARSGHSHTGPAPL